MLGNTERRVLAAYGSDHAAATCEDCRRDHRLDLVDQLRLHIIHCQGIAAALDERIEHRSP
jgi:hypothetical protein